MQLAKVGRCDAHGTHCQAICQNHLCVKCSLLFKYLKYATLPIAPLKSNSGQLKVRPHYYSPPGAPAGKPSIIPFLAVAHSSVSAPANLDLLGSNSTHKAVSVLNTNPFVPSSINSTNWEMEEAVAGLGGRTHLFLGNALVVGHHPGQQLLGIQPAIVVLIVVVHEPVLLHEYPFRVFICSLTETNTHKHIR